MALEWLMQNLFILAMLFALNSSSECLIKNTDGQKTTPKNDALYALLKQLPTCPPNVQALKASLLSKGMLQKAAMVGNRGFHNSSLGSFSFFESVSGAGVKPGEFFFGHFTALENSVVELDQEAEPGKLLIELIAWDSHKKLYNFYEHIGQRTGGQWFYRGDSRDALADNSYLYRTPPAGSVKFGTSMRCSACHSSGGPIMKELAMPNNDWWSKSRPLPLAPNLPSPQVAGYLNKLIDAGEFASLVAAGIAQLESSPSYRQAKSSLSLQEQLRPLFCETEINLESDFKAWETSVQEVQIPSAFFVNPFLAADNISIPSENYQAMLSRFHMRFPETERTDADHAWLTPVKGYADLSAVQALIAKGIIDDDFAAKIYAIDLATPTLSQTRCNLLLLVPADMTSNWQSEFISNLRTSSQPGAQELAGLLADPDRGRSFQQMQAQAYLREVNTALMTPEGLERYFRILLDLRARVFVSEISQNPRGQIMEPGFRVVFPEAGYAITTVL